MSDPLLEVTELKKHFPVESGFLDRLISSEQKYVKAVDGVSLSVDRGETLGVVGESGCGKSTLGKTILRLLDPTAGEIWYDGERLDNMPDEEVRDLREQMQIIFQDPAASLNPRRRIRDIIRRPMEVHDIGSSRRDRNQRVEELIEQVGMSTNQLDRYPHEFSGGQQQRVGIARALAVDPEFIVADEPVSALDVSVQAQILNLIEELREEYELTILFIAHDLSIVRHISDTVMVMYLGKVMEYGTTEEVFERYQHPYTDALMEAIPNTSVEERGELHALEGEVPSPINPPSGCTFRTRCPIASEECAEQFEDRKFSASHRVHCVKRKPETHGGSHTPPASNERGVRE